MKKVLFATGNESKKKRFQKGLLENGIEILTLNDIDKKIEEKLEEKVQKQVQAAFLKAQELDIDIMNLSKWFLAETGTAPESLRDYELNTQAVAEVIHGVSGGSVQ